MKISERMLLEWQQESINTRKMEERVPTEKLSWRPHEKSMTIGRLATHIAELPVWFSRVLEAACKSPIIARNLERRFLFLFT